MRKEKAFKLIKSYFEAREFPVEGLKEGNNYFQAMLGQAILAFQYHPEDESLRASALIYQFSKEPRPGVLAELEEEGREEERGEIRYEPENKALYITRSYLEEIEESEFDQEVSLLAEASLEWSGEKLGEIASKVFHPEELED